MKVRVSTDQMRFSLGHVRQAVAERPCLPILRHVLLVAGSGLELAATDGDTWVRHRMDADTIQPGRIAVPVESLDRVMALAMCPVLELEMEEEETLVVCGQSRHGRYYTRVNGMKWGEFPSCPPVSGPSVETEGFSRAVEQVAFATAKGTTGVLSGVLVKYEGEGGLSLVGTDGYRLSESRLPAWGDALSPFSFIVPPRVLQAVGEARRTTLIYGGERVTLRTPSSEVIARVMAETFPDFTRAYPRRWNTQVTVSALALREAVATLVYLEDSTNHVLMQRGRIVTLVPGQYMGNMVVKSDRVILLQALSYGVNTCEIDASVIGPPVDIRLDLRCLADLLETVGESRLVIEYTYGGAVVFRIDSFRHVIMPIGWL